MGRTRSRSSLAGLILFIAALIGLAVWYTHTDDAEDTTEHVAVKGPQRVAVSASWVDSSWTGYVAIGLLETDLKDVAFGLSDFSGNQYPYAPKWSASVGGSYDTGNGIFAAFDVSA